MSASCVYLGAVRHRRHEVRPGAFRHPLGLAYLDLDELPDLLGGRLVRRRPGVVRFRRRDYLGDPAAPLREAVADRVQEHTGRRPQGPIRLLAGLRCFGHCFNPVSFYYCFGAGGTELEHVVAEVTNTPWGERHAYVLAPGDGEAAKAMHVSPFMDMDQRYRWQVGTPGESLEVHIENRRGHRVAFDATLSLRRRELTPASLRRLTPSARVLALIYGHALGLKLRGVPVHRHPRERAA